MTSNCSVKQISIMILKQLQISHLVTLLFCFLFFLNSPQNGMSVFFILQLFICFACLTVYTYQDIVYEGSYNLIRVFALPVVLLVLCADHFLSFPLCLLDYPLNHWVQFYVRLQHVGGWLFRGQEPNVHLVTWLHVFLVPFFCVFIWEES